MHTPQDEESKRLPFEEAASGAVALENPVTCSHAIVPFRRSELTAIVPCHVAEPRAQIGAGKWAPWQSAHLPIWFYLTRTHPLSWTVSN